MNLPDGFLECMKNTLGKDYDEYIEYLDKVPYRGLRVNTLKATPEKVNNALDFLLSETPFCEQGFYIDNDLKGVGNHPYHHAGAFYLQEPSAMSAVEALGVNKGDKVLDLCAAPGGKSTQIAAKLGGTGLLWANEYVSSRAKILYSNIERCGVTNAVVSNADTTQIAKNLQGFFDKVLVDAPCSGEGMIRRESNAITEWKKENREMCAKRQAEILDNASLCLKQNGILVYSTCTLSLEENEYTVEAFLNRHTDYELVEIEKSFGRSGYTDKTKLTRRILFADGGEGHFVAKLKKKSTENCLVKEFQNNCENSKIFDEFYESVFNDKAKNVHINNGVVYLLPDLYPQTKGIKILKAGIKAGEIVKNRFIPNHELFVSKSPCQIEQVENLTLNDTRVVEFLKGLEIDCDKKGYVGVAVDGIMLGFGKASNGKLKNHYPKGLRIF